MDIKSVNFLSNGQKIVGRIVKLNTKSTQSRPGIVFFHGMGSDKEGWIERAKPLAEKGFVCLVFDFRGCGESEGDLSKQTFQDAIDDAFAGYDFLVKQENIDPEKIGVVGRSFGGYLAAVVSGKRKVNALLLSVPANFPDSVLNKTYLDYSADLVAGESQATKAIEDFKGDLMIVEHELDQTIPQIVVKKYFEMAKKAKSKKYKIIKNAVHHMTNPRQNEEFIQMMTNWSDEVRLK